jgi:hypothetical protein
MYATLSFIDERQFLTVIEPTLPPHECANPTPAESTAEPLHSVADSAATKEAATDPAATKEAAIDPAPIEPLHEISI